MILCHGVGADAPGCAPVPAAREWTVEVARDDDALVRLAGELAGLYARSPAATPFQAPAWQSAWWAAYGTPGALRLVLVRCRGRLVAAAPLTLDRRYGFPVLVPLAAGQSDFTDILLDPAYLDGAVRHLGRALLAEPGWCALDLAEVRPGAMAHLLAQRWPRPAWRAPASVCLELPGTDVGALLARLPGRTAGKARAKLRKIELCGVTAERVPAHQAAEAVHALLDLHVLQWRGRPMNPEHARHRFRRHLSEAVPAMVRDGQAAVTRYRRDGGLVAADLALIGHRFVGAYLYGAVPELRDRVDVALMLLREDLALARDRGRTVVSLLRGEEPYKMKWRPDAVRNQRIVLGRTAPAAALAALVRGRARLAEHRRPRPPARTTTRPQPDSARDSVRGSAPGAVPRPEPESPPKSVRGSARGPAAGSAPESVRGSAPGAVPRSVPESPPDSVRGSASGAVPESVVGSPLESVRGAVPELPSRSLPESGRGALPGGGPDGRG